MACNHDNKYLMGTADGIVCRACGAVFKDFSEISGVDAPAPEKPAEAPATPKKARTRKK